MTTMTIDEIGEFLETQGATDEEIDEFLEHHGVKGQQWGVRRAQKQAARADNRAKNKASRAKDKQAFGKAVDKARADLHGGKDRDAIRKAKADYHKNKTELGSREAKKIIQKARAKKAADVRLSRQARDGREAAGMLGVAFGATLLSAVLSPPR